VLNKTLPVPTNGAILITGAGQGIGKATAIQLSEKGFYVFAGIRNEKHGDTLKSESKNPDKIIPIQLDISKDDEIESSVQRIKAIIEKNKLKLIGLINNAGYAEPGPLELQTREYLTKQFDVNVVSQVIVTRAFLPLLRDATSTDYQSRILLISSGLGRLTLPFTSGPYSATKHALESIGDSLRREVAAFNIKVIVIEPGAIESNFKDAASLLWNKILTNEDKERLGESVFNYYQERCQKGRARFDKRAPVNYITDEIENSLLDSSPFTRYQGGNDAKYKVAVAELLPDLLQDLVLQL